jgi:hypothetical protein
MLQQNSHVTKLRPLANALANAPMATASAASAGSNCNAAWEWKEWMIEFHKESKVNLPTLRGTPFLGGLRYTLLGCDVSMRDWRLVAQIDQPGFIEPG